MGFITDLFVTGGWVTDQLSKVLDYIMLWINDFIYSIVSSLFKIFFAFVNLDILESFDALFYIMNRIFLLLGILMLFKLLFSFLTYLVSPDKLTDSSTGAGVVVKNIFITLILLVIFMPGDDRNSIGFDLIYRAEDALIQDAFVERLILGVDEPNKNLNDTEDDKITKGDQMAYMMWISFFVTVDPEEDVGNSDFKSQSCLQSDVDKGYESACEEVRNAVGASVLGSGSIDDLNAFNRDQIKAHTIISAVAGIFLIFMLVGYIIDIGIRAFKLVFLQIIAPIPIISYIDPNTKQNLTNWAKTLASTFIDLFLRIALMLLAMVLFSNIPSIMDTSTEAFSELRGITYAIAYFMLVIAIFLFAKMIPKLLQDILGIQASGSSSFNPVKGFGRTMVGAAGGLAAMGLGGIVGGALGAAHAGAGAGNRLKGFLGGSITGSARGAVTGAKSTKASDIMRNMKGTTTGVRDAHYKTMAEGGLKNRIFHGLGSVTGQQQYYDKQIKDIEKAKSAHERKSDNARRGTQAARNYENAVKAAALKRFNKENGTNYTNINEAYNKSGEYSRIMAEYEKAKKEGIKGEVNLLTGERVDRQLNAEEHKQYQDRLNAEMLKEKERVDAEYKRYMGDVRTDAFDNTIDVDSSKFDADVRNAAAELSNISANTDVNVSQDDLMSRDFKDIISDFDADANRHDSEIADANAKIKNIKNKNMYKNGQ